MSLGKNIQYLRKEKKITQEEFAEDMKVSRQIVSKWESDDVVPELGRLVEMCNFFSCKLDALVRENLSVLDNIYSEVSIQTVEAFKMARYVMITPKPEDDVITYMKDWAQKSGLLSIAPDVKQIGWDFPYVSSEQQNRFGLRGYVAAYVLPEGFEPQCEGVEIAEQQQANYAVITVKEPFVSAFERITNAYKHIMSYLDANGFKKKPDENFIACFECSYNKEGVNYMDIFIHTDAVTKGNLFTQF